MAKPGLKEIIEGIKKQHGKESIMIYGDKVKSVPSISTGSISLDLALGINGIPIGRIVEIYGAESSGKTTLALNAAAEVHANGGTVAFIDAEHALDPYYAKNLGVNMKELIVSQPDSGEEALQMLETLVNTEAIDLIIIDSVAALTPQAEINGEIGDAHIGLLARLMSQALRKLTSKIAKSNTTVIFINQIRDNIGAMGYGPKTTTTGGKGLKFFSSVRIQVAKIATLKKGEDSIGNRIKATVIKNKVAAPAKIAQYDIMFGTGISRAGELIEYGLKYKLINQSGSWFSYLDEKIGQGKEKVRELLRTDKDFAKKLESQIIAEITKESEKDTLI
jgi:recombination protein RecA